MVTEFQFIVIDKSRLPIVVIKVAEDIRPTLKDYETFLDALSSLLDLHSETYWVIDAARVKFASSGQRFMAETWLKREEMRMRAKVKGVFFIRSSFWTTVALKTMFAFAKLPVPMRFLSRLNDVEKLIAKDVRMVPAVSY
jgi:hypothetical protein